MKNLFRLGTVVLLTSAFISCSKSDHIASAETDPGSARAARSRESTGDELWTKFFPAVNQPRETKLGEPTSVFLTGDQAVFYVIISEATSSDVYTGTLTLTDDATGATIQSLTMLPNTDPAVAGLSVPEEITLSLQPFMFVVVDLDGQYTGKTVSLSSSVQQPTGETSVAAIPAAFTVL